MPTFSAALIHPFQKHCMSHCTVHWGMAAQTTAHVPGFRHSPAGRVHTDHTPLWHLKLYIKHWSLSNPHIVPLTSYCIPTISLVPCEWFMVIYCSFSLAGHKPNPAGFGDQDGIPRGQTESPTVPLPPAEPQFCHYKWYGYCEWEKLTLHVHNIQYS